MQQDPDMSPPREHPGASGDVGGPGGDPLQALTARLRALGFEVPPFSGAGGNVAGGVPLEVPVQKLLDGSTGAIRALLENRVPLTFSLTDLGGAAAIDALQRFSKLLYREIANLGGRGENIGMAVDAGQLPLGAWRAATAAMPGPRYVLLDARPPAKQGALHTAMERAWRLLWRHRHGPLPLLPAYAATVRPGCRLLGDEAATSVLPVDGIQVPEGSAWLPLRLHLPGFANDRGELQWERVAATLAAGLELAEEIMSRLHWPHPGQRADAMTNRRLAVSVTGLGALVAHRGLDPRRLDTLEWLTAIVRRVRDLLWAGSARMARHKGCLPALHLADPSSRWDDSEHREHWRQRWQQALEQAAVRHRNLFVMSPYSVLPPGVADFAYADLLPVIAFADAWSFAAVPGAADFDLREFTAFHKRAWAVIRRSRADSLIAAGT